MRLPGFPVLPPWRGLPLAAICALYLFTGLVSHDPWKNDDATHFGVAWNLITSNDWLIPQLGGAPWLETPPLYYWIAAICGHLFGGLLPLHGAVRLASGIFGALFLALLAFAGRLLHKASYPEGRGDIERETGRQAGNAAALIAIGCLGLLVPIHDTQPLTALLAASAAAYAGFAVLPLRPVAGGLLAGLGIGLGFLASGLAALINLVPLLLLLPLNRHWRSRTSLGGLLIAAALGVLLCASWPLLLATRHPDIWAAWQTHAIAGIRFQANWLRNLPALVELLSWFAWPALPLAIWALWLNRRRLHQPIMALPLIGAMSSFIALLLLGEPRPLQALPLLVPLILQAASSVHLLRRGATNAFDWFGMMTFTMLAGLIWLGGIAMTTGVPGKIAHNFAKLEPGFVAQFSPLAYGVAALLTLAWFWLIFASPRSPWRAVSHWAAGATLTWVLVIALLLPWIDYGKSYRGVAESLRRAIPDNSKCIIGRNLGPAQQVSLEYFAGITTLRGDAPASSLCALLLEQGPERSNKPPAGWRKIWEGHRPGDRSERLRLFQRT